MRRQLAVLVAATTAVVVIAFLVPLGLLVRQLAEDRAIATATQESQSLAVVVGVVGVAGADGADATQLQEVVKLLNDRGVRRTTVFLPDGTSVGASPAGEAPDVDRAVTTTTSSGAVVVQPVYTAAGRTVIVTTVPESVLRQGVGRAWVSLAVLGVLLVAVAIAVATRLARRVTRPLGELTAAAHDLGQGRLDTRVAVTGPPEVAQLAEVVNQLAGRIDHLLAAERELVADLSHRLRTPVTALRLDVEGLSAPADAERLLADVDALERAVDDVIREARRPRVADDRCDATEVVRDRLSFWTPLAEDQARAMAASLPSAPVPVAVGGAELGAAVDALLENVFAHTPEGTGCAVTLAPRPGGGGVLTVEDGGPGFPPGVDARGASGAGSTGLGLDIVRRTARDSGGAVSFETGHGGGALVRVDLGPPPARGQSSSG